MDFNAFDNNDWFTLISAVLGLLALAFSIVSSASTKKFTISQIELARQDFAATNIPDIEIDAYTSRKNPGTTILGSDLILIVTNHSQTVTINNLKVFLTIEELGECKGTTFMFTTFSDLKPQQNLKVESMTDFEEVITRLFPDYKVGHAGILSSNSSMVDFETYPATLNIEYTPRFTGANKVEEKKQLYLFIKRENA